MIQPVSGTDSDTATLVRAARSGCSTSFGALLQRNRQDILSILHRQARHTFEVDELYQDVAVRAYQALPELRDPTRVSGWLVRIAYNTSVDWIRRRRVRDRTARLEFDPPDPDPRRGVERHADDAEGHLPRLMDEIARLSPRHAAAILLRGLEGMAYAEIADCLHVSIPCVKTSLHRARRRLRNRMAATVMKDLPFLDPLVPRDPSERNKTS